MEVIVIAGGTGFIGTELSTYFQNKGMEVRFLTRNKSKLQPGFYHWNPETKEIDSAVWTGATVLINLSGAGIADERWNRSRVAELFSSRIVTTEFLAEQITTCPTIKQVVQASGGTCYGYLHPEKTHIETDPFGKDLIGQLTHAWENAALQFPAHLSTVVLRFGIVLGKRGGAIPKLANTIRMGIGSPLGSGKQQMPWIHLEDLIGFIDFSIFHQLKGVFNVAAGNCSNKELTYALAGAMKKKIIFPAVPGFVLYLVLGKRAELLLKGMRIDPAKMQSTGFIFQHPILESALLDIFKS